MRFIVFSIFMGGWVFMWWWTYVFHLKACDTYVHAFDKTHDLLEGAHYPLGFQWGDASPVLVSDPDAWRDSILDLLNTDEHLLIKGIAYRDEVRTMDAKVLARARARAIARIFEEKAPRNLVEIDAGIGQVGGDIRGRIFNGFEVHILRENEEVRQAPHCALLYFPFDSLNPGKSDEVTDMLKQVARDYRGSDGIIQLSSVTSEAMLDEQARKVINWRLRTLSDILAEAGFDRENILSRPGILDGETPCPAEIKTDPRDWIMIRYQ